MAVDIRHRYLLVILVVALAGAGPANAVTRYVDDATGNDSANSPYTNAATPAQTIQAAIDVSVSNDLILVAAGVYDTGTRIVDGSLKNRVAIDVPVTVRATGAREATIIKGGGPMGNTAVRCVWLGTNASLEGFTLTNGHTRTSGGIDEEQSGGGVYCGNHAGTMISNCVIAGCEARYHGGGVFRGTLRDCVLDGNSADGSNSDSDGGGAYGARLYDCIVRNNYAEDEAGGLYGCNATRCVVEGNESPEGGGLFSGTATACILRDNTGDFGGGAGGLFTLRDCLVVGNTAEYGGGTRAGNLYNCTVVGNSATYGGGVMDGNIWNCIIQSNSATTAGADWYAFYAVAISHSCTTPLPAGDGNIDDDPAFVDFGAGNYRLASGSPCINSGTNDVVITSVDLDGSNRIVGARVDMGAYEFQGEPATHTLTVVSAHGGTDPGTETADYGTALSQSVTNSPVSDGVGTQYVCTAGTVVSNDFTQVNPTNVTLTLTNNATLTWQWQTEYELTTGTNGSGSVTDADGWYASGASTVLTATATAHWSFTHWSGDTNGCGIADNVITAEMTRARSITASFAQTSPAGGVIRYVDDDSADPQSPYISAGHAATSIQDAVDVSEPNDLILVSAGVYDTGTRIVDGSMKNRVVIDVPLTVRGVDGRDVTIIKGEGPLGDSAVRCVYIGTNAVLEGFTLTNGHTRMSSAYFGTEIYGGGVYCSPGADAVISNCVLAGNEAYRTGGGACRGTLHDCLIAGNRAVNVDDLLDPTGDGGGVYASTLYDCIVRDNYANDEGGGLYSSPATRCVIEENDSPEGGGMFKGSATASVIRNNTGTYGAGAGHWAVLRDCLLVGNMASATSGAGGGANGATLYNCTVVSNSAFYAGGARSSDFRNCIVWGNTATSVSNWTDCSFIYSCTAPLPPGEGNTDEHPAFVDFSGGDCRLLPSSPCIDTGSNGVVTTDTDLDDNPRVVFGIVDMGAYEYVYSMNDYDGDGMSNDDEQIAGTDVTDPDSRLAFINVLATGATELVWIGGTQTRQFVEMKTNLTSTTEQWVVIHTNEPPTSITNVLALPDTAAPARFYRIRVEQE